MLMDSARLQRLLGGADLARLRKRLRARYERGHSGDATFTLTPLDAAERCALEGLLGRRGRAASSMRLSVVGLDTALSDAGVASDLRTALETLDGPITDHAAEATARRSAWETMLAQAPQSLQTMLSAPAAVGVLKRLSGDDPARASALLRSTAKVFEQLPVRGIQRSRLAAQTLGDAHALDTGRPVATLLMRALRSADDERPRDSWAAVGVLVNELARPVLVLNLPSPDSASLSEILGAARRHGQPLHLNLRALLQAGGGWPVRGVDIYVCENPAVIAAAADVLGASCPPLVCTEGMPAAAQRILLRQLADSGAALHYHGDFDWPGIRIGNIVIGRLKARPWRFCAADYAPRQGRVLVGLPATAGWDADLTDKMTATGLVLEEEGVEDCLLADLRAAIPQIDETHGKRP